MTTEAKDKQVTTLAQAKRKRPNRSSEPVHLGWHDAGRSVVMETDPHDRCVRMVSELFELIKAEEARQEGQKRIKAASEGLVARLTQWLKDNKSRLREAHLTLRDRHPLFLVVAKGAKYDRALEQSMAKLDLEVNNNPDFHPLSMNMLLLPGLVDEDVQAFMHHQRHVSMEI